MIARFRVYRSYGHGIVISAMLAPTPKQMLIAASIGGLILGVIL